jgi:hypothetical protein
VDCGDKPRKKKRAPEGAPSSSGINPSLTQLAPGPPATVSSDELPLSLPEAGVITHANRFVQRTNKHFCLFGLPNRDSPDRLETPRASRGGRQAVNERLRLASYRCGVRGSLIRTCRKGRVVDDLVHRPTFSPPSIRGPSLIADSTFGRAIHIRVLGWVAGVQEDAHPNIPSPRAIQPDREPQKPGRDKTCARPLLAQARGGSSHRQPR